MGAAVVVLVHGFNVSDPERTVGPLEAGLKAKGHDVHKFCYGPAGFLDVRIANPNLAYALLSQIKTIKALVPHKEVVPVGHSNGCAIIHKAGELQPELLFTRCVYVSPALERKARLPEIVSRCDVLYNEGDYTVGWSRYIPFHPWGDMGKTGYRGPDRRYYNHDCSDVVDGHSDWFAPEKQQFTVSKVATLLEDHS